MSSFYQLWLLWQQADHHMTSLRLIDNHAKPQDERSSRAY